jgi:hypothetical protein
MAHMHYTGTGKMHSFRGLLADGAQERIRIQGATGEIAWRITKFAIIAKTPGTQTQESIVKIFREDQTTIDGVINFDDDELLAAGYYRDNSNDIYSHSELIIFDNSLFSRNIFVTHSDAGGGGNLCNYYIELEEVKVSAAGMAQLSVAAARRGYVPGT